MRAVGALLQPVDVLRRAQRRPRGGAALAAVGLVLVGVASSSTWASPNEGRLAPTPPSRPATVEPDRPRGEPAGRLVEAPYSRVDLNRASVDELMTLKGIGRKKAEAIVAYRRRHPFTRLTQLLHVKGIGRKTLQRLRPRLAIGTNKASRPPSSRPAPARSSSSKVEADGSEGATATVSVAPSTSAQGPGVVAVPSSSFGTADDTRRTPWRSMVTSCP